MTRTTDRIVTVQCRAFGGEGPRPQRCLVNVADSAEPVRVWDEVAGYYTTRHSLTQADERRIRRLAGRAERG